MKFPKELSSSTDASSWLSVEDTPSTSSASSLGASPAIDRHNPIILSDSRRNPTPQLPLIIRSKSVSQQELIIKSPKSQVEGARHKKKNETDQKAKKKSVGKSVDFTNRSSVVTMPSSNQNLLNLPESSRYLLSENMLSDSLQDLYPPPEAAAEAQSDKVLALETDEKVSSPSSSLDSKFIFSSSDKPCNKKSEQVVALRVSLHCKGCAAKVRKHISRMEGVTSFSIDFAAKKVTVMGNVTPLEVLSTISKVKNAQLWTPNITKSRLSC